MVENETIIGDCINHPAAPATGRCARCHALLCADCASALGETLYCQRCFKRARLRTDILRSAEVFFYTTVIIFITSAVLSFSGEKRSVLVDWAHLSAYGAVVIGIVAGGITFLVNRIQNRKVA